MGIRKRALSVESLERRELLTTTVFEVEPNNNELQGTPFQLDPADNSAELIGTSVNDDDDDWFRFTVPADGVLNAEVTSPNGNFAELDVERLDGTEILETDPDDGINSACGVVTAGEELFVRFRSDNSMPADYNGMLTLDPNGTGTGCNNGAGGPGPVGNPTEFYPEVENNNQKARATPFELIQDGVIQLQGTSQNDRDRDFFVFTMPADGDVTFEVFSPNGEFADLEIEDRFGNEIIETEPDSGINTGSVTLRGGDTFFLRMRADDALAAQYEVNIGLTAPTGAIIGEGQPKFFEQAQGGGHNALHTQPGDVSDSDSIAPLQLKTWSVNNDDIFGTRDRQDATDVAMADINALFGVI